MQLLTRRSGLRALCACAAGLVLVPRAGAQVQPLPKPDLGHTQDPWALAKGHMDRALAMSGAVARSLDSLTASTSKALEQVERLKTRLGTLGRDLEKFKKEKEALLEEYRNGLFCSGCGKTRSQILAVGDTFPHPGQKVVRPTAQQIAAKEKELQAPIDRTERSIDSASKELADNDAKGTAGMAQIRLGTRLWRTATSHAENSVSRGAAHTFRAFEQQLQELETHRKTAQGALAVARAKEDAELARFELATWERLLVKHQSDLDTFLSASARAKREVAEREGDERRRIMSYVSRPELFARVGGPPAVQIHWTSTDPEMGVLYLMGRLPDGPYTALPNVQQFCNQYRSTGREFPLAGQMAVAGPGVPNVPAPPAPAPAATGKLLQALP